MPESRSQVRRLNCLIRLMRENRYPNHTIVLNEMRRHDPDASFTPKTIHRDVEYLKREYNAPIVFDPSMKGYFLSSPGWSGYKSLLYDDEVTAASLGAHLADSALPESRLKEQVRRGADGLVAQNPGDKESFDMQLCALIASICVFPVDRNVFQVVFEQWRSRHVVVLDYCPPNGRCHLLHVEPHILALNEGAWYLRGRVVGRRGTEFSNFALHRVRSAARDPRLFEPDQNEIARVSSGSLFDLPRVDVARLRLRGRPLVYMAERTDARPEPGADGWGEMTLYNMEERTIVNFVLSSNGDAELVEPSWLRKRISGMARTAMERNS